MQNWSVDYANDYNTEVYTYEGKRNVIICSFSRLHEFELAALEVFAARDYVVQAYEWVQHSEVYIVDNEGFVSKFQIQDEVD